MKRSTWLWWLAVAASGTLAALLAGRDFGASASSLSRGAHGLMAARHYLEQRGAEVEVLDRPAFAATPSGGGPRGVLVLAFPWQQAIADGDLRALGDHLRAGGTVLLAFSGNPPGAREARILRALELESKTVRGGPPLAPASWWVYRRERWALHSQSGLPELATAAFERAPSPPAGARIFYAGGDGGAPLVFDYPLHRGRVVALPAGVLANAWIREAGNADLLEALLHDLGSRWSFDEYHHGWAAAAGQASTTGPAWDLFVAHLILIYLLAWVRLGRPFGAPWRERLPAAGSTSSFLRRLGALHHALGHHRQAAEVLRERARAIDPDLALPDEGSETAPSTNDEKRFMKLARELSKLQRRMA